MQRTEAQLTLEKALQFCDAHDQEAMISELFGSVQAVTDLVGNQSGCHVARAIVRMRGRHCGCVKQMLAEATPYLQKTKYGRRVLAQFSQRES